MTLIAIPRLNALDSFSLMTGRTTLRSLQAGGEERADELLRAARAHVPAGVQGDDLAYDGWSARALRHRLSTTGCRAIVISRRQLLGRDGWAIRRAARDIEAQLICARR